MISYSLESKCDERLTFEEFKIKAHEMVLDNFKFSHKFELSKKPDFDFDKVIVNRNFDSYGINENFKGFSYDVLCVNQKFSCSNKISVYHYNVYYTENEGVLRNITLIRNYMDAKTTNKYIKPFPMRM